MPDLPWFVYAIPFAMIGLIAFAAFYKWLEVRAAAEWPETTGKVVVSTSETRKVKTFDDDRQDMERDGGRGEEERNFAKIVYEYQVSGQKMRASRVSIGEDLGNFEVAETIARYPVGKVVTVYYNPRTPREAVLERDVPKGMFGCVAWFVVIAVFGTLLTFFGFNQLTEYARQLLVNPNNSPIVVGLAAMGTVAFLFALALHRQANVARGWPKVTGRITRSEIDEFEGRLTPKSTLTTLYRPLISYAYEFNGIKYSGDELSLGGKVTANTPSFAKKQVAKFPIGKTIEVHVNPQNASEAVLKPAPAHAWVLWISAGLFLAGAWFISQLP
jgi:hypothetical protein